MNTQPLLRWPLTAWNWIAHHRRPTRAAHRPDHTRIALLEHELFGIAPEPGTTAAAVIGLQLALRPLRAGTAPDYREERRP
ncbi:hypothetical protein CF54_04075 [Streptomyces sp. Tu 6176]|uniref:hypothetical protein n=1 Tax=Streptomyces sp. Tu 6176 TaxID=1470557 RepID=UPI000448BD2A|nr:hypothetical protein [Streptomyces sp. Tu 6176]EYT83993.1 hypothetical protein CF54_04075 [Streptomyces sp. Tu 6176]